MDKNTYITSTTQSQAIPTTQLYLAPYADALFYFSGEKYASITNASFGPYCVSFLYNLDAKSFVAQYQNGTITLSATVKNYLFVVNSASGIAGYGDARVTFNLR